MLPTDRSTNELGNFEYLDDLFRLRAADEIQVPLLAFPTTDVAAAGHFEFFSGQDLNRFADQAARHYASSNIEVVRVFYRTATTKTVAVMGLSDLDWITSVFGLVRAGYHAYSFTVTIQRIYHRKTIFFPNPNLPLTCENLTLAINDARPAVLNAVPYVLKLLGENARGIEALGLCGRVISAGSGCPDELGDRLIDHGVSLATYFASTETAMLGTSLDRPPGDSAWAYVRPSPDLLKHVWPKPVGDGTFEFVYLPGFPSLVTSNSNEPHGSYHSKDIFSPHPTIPNAWKHVGRIDDRITLLNGEKFLPLVTEGRVQEHPLVEAAVVFGESRPVPGILVLRAHAARSMSDEEFIDAIDPAIQAANRDSEGFSKLGREMIVPLDAGTEFPVTDKRSIVRAQVYQIFRQNILDAYERLGAVVVHEEGLMNMSLEDLEKRLKNMCQSVTGIWITDPATDFFNAGIDSLQAIRFRAQICKDLGLGRAGKALNENIIFETGNINKLAALLYRLSHNEEEEESEKEDEVGVMKRMIDRFSAFAEDRPLLTQHQPPALQTGYVVLLTGATGSVGVHILARLLQQADVHQIFCPVRGSDCIPRLQGLMQTRGLPISGLMSKVVVLPSNLDRLDLGLSPQDYGSLAAQLTHIIHCAWPVNFQIHLQSFEPHIAGVRNLLQLSLASQKSQPARFMFCSSITASIGSQARHTRIPESPVRHLWDCSRLGYGRSKLVAESVVEAAVEKADAAATILRIGQVTGDQKHGIWKDTEMIPMIIRSGLRMRALPALQWDCQWLPVNTLADVILDLAGISTQVTAKDQCLPGGGGAETTIDCPPSPPQTPAARTTPSVDGAQDRECNTSRRELLVYNVCSPHLFSWASEFLPALERAGCKFETIPFDAWLSRLRDPPASSGRKIRPEIISEPSSSKADLGGPAPEEPPVRKLLTYLQDDFLDDSRPLVFDIEQAKRHSPTLKSAPRVIIDGLVTLMAKNWAGEINGKLAFPRENTGPTHIVSSLTDVDRKLPVFF
ncbi:MAG: hypothetical protein Q9177_002006 [Variospora cf. flavescens]